MAGSKRPETSAKRRAVGEAIPLRTELAAGVATFLTMAYILLVQPLMLTGKIVGPPTGMDPAAVFAATALASGLVTIAMGVYARLPIGLAPGMGQNVLFVLLTAAVAKAPVAGSAPWQTALGIVFWAGVLFLVVSLLPLRRMLFDVLSPSQKHAVGVGIGLMIAVIGLRNGEVFEATGLHLRGGPDAVDGQLVLLAGLLTITAFHMRNLPGAIVAGLAASAAVAVGFGQLHWPTQWVGFPDHSFAAAFKLDLWGALAPKFLPFVAIVFVVIVLDATGTLIALAEAAGLAKDGNFPQARQALVVDSSGSIVGACLGTSTLTAYVESAAGIQQGGRTGVTAIVVGCLFLACLPFGPAVKALAGYAPLTAAALVAVGVLMARGVREIDWDDFTEALPALLLIVGICFTQSIADGFALGLIAYPSVKLVGGRWRDLSFGSLLLAALMIAYLIYARPQLAG